MTNQNTDPNQDPNKVPDQDTGSPSNDLKPLTESELASMTTEEITAHAEKLESQVKDRKQQTPDEIRANQLRRLQKAQEKAFSDDQTTTPADQKPNTEKLVAQADLLTLAKTDFELGSKQQQVLQWYVDNGKVKSYAEAMNHPAVKAELQAIHADSNAEAVIDENDTEENKLRTKKEAIANARATGEIPEDPELRKALIEDNLANMSALR